MSPVVGTKHFSYSPKGIAAAKKAAKQTGMPMKKMPMKQMPAKGKK